MTNERKLIRLLKKISYKQPLVETFKDFVHLYSLMFRVTTTASDHINNEYYNLISKFNKRDHDCFNEAIDYVYKTLQKKPYDLLGNTYQLLTKQKYTYYLNTDKWAANMMILNKDWSKSSPFLIYEQNTNGGRFSLESCNLLKIKGINYEDKVVFVSSAKNKFSCKMCFLQLSLINAQGIIREISTNSSQEEIYDEYITPALFANRLLNLEKERRRV